MTLKEMPGLLVFGCLLGVAVGLGRFGFDLWRYFYGASANLDYAGLVGALIAAVLAGFFILLSYFLLRTPKMK